MAAVASISTAPLHGYHVLFSPYSPHKLAFTGAHNYGLAGSGAMVIFEESENGLREVRRYVWKDGLFDITWSEVSEPILVAGGGDGAVIIFDQTVADAPVAVLPGHTAEVSSVHWSVTRQEQLVLSGSWDATVRLWDPQSHSCISVFPEHSGMVYDVCWATHLPHTFASVAGDRMLRLWDSAQPRSTACVGAHSGEILACDWSKYDQNVIFTAGVDTTIKMWDIRRLVAPMLTLSGHTQAVRRVKCDPYNANIVASCSYDFTVRLWDVSEPSRPLVETVSHHSEFTFGLDMCSLAQGKVVDCSWDKTIKIYHLASISPKLEA